MKINNNGQAHLIYPLQNSASNMSTHSAEPIHNKNLNDTVNISNAGLNATANWQKVENNYDVSNLSLNETANMMSSLIDSKLMSATDGLTLMAPPRMNFSPETKFNLLATQEKSLAFAKENGGSVEGIGQQERVVDILKSLQELFRKASA